MLDLDPYILFFSIFFGCIGLGYFSYGKKNNAYFLVAGVGLMICPYFATRLFSLLAAGIFFIGLPYFLNWFYPIE
jgi:hypothetical protein